MIRSYSSVILIMVVHVWHAYSHILCIHVCDSVSGGCCTSVVFPCAINQYVMYKCDLYNMSVILNSIYCKHLNGSRRDSPYAIKGI